MSRHRKIKNFDKIHKETNLSSDPKLIPLNTMLHAIKIFDTLSLNEIQGRGFQVRIMHSHQDGIGQDQGSDLWPLNFVFQGKSLHPEPLLLRCPGFIP